MPTIIVKTVPERSALMRLLPPAYFTDCVYPRLRVLVAEAFSANFKLDPWKHIEFEAPVLNPALTQLSSPIKIDIVTIGFEDRVDKLTEDECIVQKQLAAAILRALYVDLRSDPTWSHLLEHQSVVDEHAAFAIGEYQLVWFFLEDPRGLHV